MVPVEDTPPFPTTAPRAKVDQRERRSPRVASRPGGDLLAWSWLAGTACVLLLAVRLRYRGDALGHAAPVAWPGWGWWTMISLLVAACSGAAWAGRHALRRRGVREALRDLAVFPAFLAYEWLALPPVDWRPMDWGVLGLLAGCVVAGLAQDSRRGQPMGLGRTGFLPACRWLALPTAAGIGLLVAAPPRVEPPGVGEVALSLAGYPFYAAAQLAAMAVFLPRRLRRLGASSASAVAASGCMLALVHWPNGLLMVGCLLGGLLWAGTYARWRSLWAVALSMGLLATAASKGVSREVTQNLRTGPIYVHRHIEG